MNKISWLQHNYIYGRPWANPSTTWYHRTQPHNSPPSSKLRVQAQAPAPSSQGPDTSILILWLPHIGCEGLWGGRVEENCKAFLRCWSLAASAWVPSLSHLHTAMRRESQTEQQSYYITTHIHCALLFPLLPSQTRKKSFSSFITARAHSILQPTSNLLVGFGPSWSIEPIQCAACLRWNERMIHFNVSQEQSGSNHILRQFLSFLTKIDFNDI